MRDDVLAIPDHLRDALWRVETAQLERSDSEGLLVCGMGGSAIGGDLAAAVLADRLSRPLLTVRGYDLPRWATADWAVLCSSYSGGTEETLACFEAAGAIGARRTVAGTGGELVDRARQAGAPVIGLPGLLSAPRAAVAYMVVTSLAAAAAAGVAPGIPDEIEGAAAFLAESSRELEARAAEIAAGLAGTLPVLYGAGLTVPVARRWKTQVNENAKAPAFFAELPEADHNEVCGWTRDAELRAGISAVMIEDRDQDSRERRRFDLTSEIVTAAGARVVRLETVGSTRAERVLWAVMLGDLVSLDLAQAAGVDPLPVEAIDRLKAALEGP
jgi:glucose/mannose-6-phosphate isomerase